MIWAFGFANLPLLQFGIAAASLPILIHLLNRRKYREMRWAAMRFLVAALQKNQRRVRIEQWLLLAARTLVILLVLGAMAKPFLESLGAVVLPGQRTHRVIVLDGSMSMAFVAGDQPRFEQAKTLAGQLVRDARKGDVLSVVLMGEPPRVVVGDASPSANGTEVVKEIDALRRPDGATDLVASFEAVDRVLGVSPIPRKEVIFVTDLQAASWRGRGAEGANADPLRRAVARLDARQVVSVVIDLGKDGGENRAVVDCRLDAPLVTVGGPAPKVIATVRNFSTKPAYNVKARLSIDGQVGPDQSVPEIAPGDDATFAFLPGFTTAGDHLVEVRIDDDALPTDNVRRLVVPVRDALSVLLVDGSPKAESFKSETDYLAQALSPDERSADPNAAGLGGPALATIRTEVVPESQLGARDLSSFDAVVLCNVAEFAPAEVAALDAFLKQGGGVVVFGGDVANADNYNRLLHRDGAGILPASVAATVGDGDPKQGGFDFDAKDFKHPIVAPFQGAAANVIAGLTGAKTWQYQKLKLPENSQAQVALFFNTGDPAIVEAPRHRGRVIQVATSADVGWTTWPLHQSYPPIMEQIVLEAAAGRLSERNVRVGQPIDRALPATAGGAGVEVTRPDETRVAAQLQPSGDVSLFHFEETDLAGLYRARFAAPVGGESLFAANVNPIESDPARLDAAGLAQAVPGWKPAVLANWRDLSQSATSVGRRGELHRPLLYGLLGMLLVESMLAWWFGNHRR